MNKYTFKSPEETKEFASQLAKKVPDGKIIALIGNLGTGKTTLAKALSENIDGLDYVYFGYNKESK